VAHLSTRLTRLTLGLLSGLTWLTRLACSRPTRLSHLAARLTRLSGLSHLSTRLTHRSTGLTHLTARLSWLPGLTRLA
jgi:hypothetical protein